ncbi:MAG: hypothetical protein ACAI25_10640, partial [Planctomycetota bacterium]
MRSNLLAAAIVLPLALASSVHAQGDAGAGIPAPASTRSASGRSRAKERVDLTGSWTMSDDRSGTVHAADQTIAPGSAIFSRPKADRRPPRADEQPDAYMIKLVANAAS